MLDGYVRVSRVGYRSGERFISPSVQREQIAAWAQARPATLLEVWEELDESGGRLDRPLLETAVERIEQGLSQGLVVASVDRFGRSLLHGLTLIERIERAGGGFFSVRDGLDLTTDTGRLVLRIMLAMAEWQLDRVRSSWDVATERAIARGVYVGPVVPTGYRKLRSGRLRPDPRVAQRITELFIRRAAGESLAALARFLEAEGVLTVYGNRGWLPDSVRRLLAKRVYLGEVRHGQWVREHAHPALTDEATWQAAQRPPVARQAPGSRTALLGGLVRCMSCGMKMHVRGNSHGHIYYSCQRHSAAGACPKPTFMSATALEMCVEDVVLDLLSRRRRPPDGAVSVAEGKVVDAQRKLAAYRDSDRVLASLGEDAYAAGLAARVQRVREASLLLVDARTRRGLHDLPAAPTLEADWPAMDVAGRREIIRGVIDCVFVEPGRRHFDERIWICPTGTAPKNLPGRGTRRATLRAYEPRRGWISARDIGARPRRWSRTRLERELGVFVDGRRCWPTAHSFQAAGRSRLYRQMQLQGGESYWARRFELPRRIPSPFNWNDERIRAQLTRYLAGKTEWPTSREFLADGYSSLRQAISGNGGVRRWAAEFAMPRPYPHSNGPLRYWTDDRIREQLTAVSQGRVSFPSGTEFRLAGLQGMHRAMQRDHTIDSWAREFGLPRQPSGTSARKRSMTARASKRKGDHTRRRT